MCVVPGSTRRQNLFARNWFHFRQHIQVRFFFLARARKARIGPGGHEPKFLSLQDHFCLKTVLRDHESYEEFEHDR